MAELKFGRIPALVSAAIFAGTLMLGAAFVVPASLSSRDGSGQVWAPLLHARDRAALALGTDSVGDVYVTKSRMLRRRTSYDAAALAASAEAIRALTERVSAPVFVLVAPTAAGIYPDALPAYAPIADEAAMLRQAAADLSGAVSWIETLSWLNEIRDEAIYFRTDSRWTTFGAYSAYKTAARKLGFSAIGFDRLVITHAAADYYGNLSAETGITDYPPDIIDLYQYDSAGAPLTVTALRAGGEVPLESYFQPGKAQETGDPYAVFAAVTEPVLRLSTERQSGKRLLVLGDSSAASILPLLAQHYASVTAVNLELTSGLPADDGTEYSQVLVLCSADTYASGSLAETLISQKGTKTDEQIQE